MTPKLWREPLRGAVHRRQGLWRVIKCLGFGFAAALGAWFVIQVVAHLPVVNWCIQQGAAR